VDDKRKTLKALMLVFLLGFLAACSQPSEKEAKRNSAPIDEMITQAESIIEDGDLLSARDKYKEVFVESFSGLTDPEDIEYVKEKIEDLNIEILFSNTICPDSELYRVKRGDTLGKIAKRYNTTIELLKKANNLTSDIIRVGQDIKVPRVEFSLVVDKSQNLLFLKKGEDIFKTYTVSTGKDNSTPVGEFKIKTKVKHPVWYRTDIGAVVPAESPENILGTRWLGFDLAGYGIHGTTEPENLGKQVTQGCVRMKNEDVEELFSIVPLETIVIILD
jgi:hypothetical protein